MVQSKNPLDNLSKLEKQKVLKRQAAEDAEKVSVLGQENEHKAAKWVKEVGKEDRKQEAQRVADTLTKLDDVKGNIVTYKGKLMEEMRKEMGYWIDDVPTGFHWASQSTDKGIVLWIKNPQGEYFAKGISLSNNPEVDLNAIARIIVTALKEMIKQEEDQHKTPNGLIVPYK